MKRKKKKEQILERGQRVLFKVDSDAWLVGHVGFITWKIPKKEVLVYEIRDAKGRFITYAPPESIEVPPSEQLRHAHGLGYTSIGLPFVCPSGVDNPALYKQQPAIQVGDRVRTKNASRFGPVYQGIWGELVGGDHGIMPRYAFLADRRNDASLEWGDWIQLPVIWLYYYEFDVAMTTLLARELLNERMAKQQELARAKIRRVRSVFAQHSGLP